MFVVTKPGIKSKKKVLTNTNKRFLFTVILVMVDVEGFVCQMKTLARVS